MKTTENEKKRKKNESEENDMNEMRSTEEVKEMTADKKMRDLISDMLGDPESETDAKLNGIVLDAITGINGSVVIMKRRILDAAHAMNDEMMQQTLYKKAALADNVITLDALLNDNDNGNGMTYEEKERLSWGRESISGFGTDDYDGSECFKGIGGLRDPYDGKPDPDEEFAEDISDTYNDDIYYESACYESEQNAFCEEFDGDAIDAYMGLDDINFEDYIIEKTPKPKAKKTPKADTMEKRVTEYARREKEAFEKLKAEIADGYRDSEDDYSCVINRLVKRGVTDPSFDDVRKALGHVMGKADSKRASFGETSAFLGLPKRPRGYKGK